MSWNNPQPQKKTLKGFKLGLVVTACIVFTPISMAVGAVSSSPETTATAERQNIISEEPVTNSEDISKDVAPVEPAPIIEEPVAEPSIESVPVAPEPVVQQPAPEPAPVVEQPVAAPPAPAAPTYANCDEVKAAGKAPIYPGQPGWQDKFDRDKDGVGCDK